MTGMVLLMNSACLAVPPDRIQFFLFFLLGTVKVPTGLEVEPEVRGNVEKPRQAQRRTRRNAAFAIDQFIDPLVRHVNCVSKFALRDIQRREKLLDQHFAWMGRFSVCWNSDHSASLNDNRLSQLPQGQRLPKRNRFDTAR